jgi:hypothetical protein
MESADRMFSFATARDVRNLIVAAEQDHLASKKRYELSQCDFYQTFMNSLTTERFFNPILTSTSKELIGRFIPSSRISIHASFVTPGEFTDTPGYFQVKFLSAGHPNWTHEYDKCFCENLIQRVTPYTQQKVRDCMEIHGWKVWWTLNHFCFQDANEYNLVQDALILGSLYKDIVPQALKTSKVDSSCLTRLDLSNLTVNNN